MKYGKWLLTAIALIAFAAFFFFDTGTRRSLAQIALPKNAPDISTVKATATSAKAENAGTADALKDFQLEPNIKAELAQKLLHSTPEEKQDVLGALAYMSFMNKVRPLLAMDKPKMSMEDMLSTFADVDTLQSRRYLTLGDAFNIKAQLLRSQYGGDELTAQIKDLQQAYQHQATELAAQYDPTKDSRYVQFKAAETAIIQKANAMNTYPNGQSREQYIIAQSESARLQIYK